MTTPRPRTRFDVAIAGVGAMGSACAAHLARNGARVVALDRFEPPHRLGSTHGRTRIIREAYFEHQLYIPLVRRALELWRALQEEDGRSLLTVTGALVAGPGEGAFLSGTLAGLRQHGVPHEVLDSSEIRRRFPMFEPAAEIRGIHEPGAGVLDVEACVSAQIRSARRAGAEIRTGEEIRGWSAGVDGVSIETSGGTFLADSLVLAAGPWIPELLPSLPLTVERQVQLWISPARPADCRVGVLPVFVLQACGPTYYGLPDMGHGVKAAFHHGGATGSRESLSRTVSESDIVPLMDELRRFLPAAAGEVREASVCYYTNTPDGHFLIDRHPEQERVWIVSACSGHGFKFAPIVGELVARSVAAGRRDDALAPFALERFAAGDDPPSSR